MDPTNEPITHIEIKSQTERHTVNIAKLVAITTALGLYKHAQTLSILTGNASRIDNLRNYASNPHSFSHHQHKDLLHILDNIIHTRDDLGYATQIGKVKSHTCVAHNDEADAGACNVAEDTETHDITFTIADPLIGSLRTWP